MTESRILTEVILHPLHHCPNKTLISEVSCFRACLHWESMYNLQYTNKISERRAYVTKVQSQNYIFIIVVKKITPYGSVFPTWQF